MIAGADGCRKGWVMVTEHRRDEIEWRIVPQLRDVISSGPTPRVLAVDIPIGLPEVGSRDCDVLARRLLGSGRASSVFAAPIRPVLGAASHVAASSIRRSLEGKGMSIQAWAIVPKIREVDELLRSDPRSKEILYEVHPEVCFYHLAGGQPLRHSKKGAPGRAERLAWLSQAFGEIPARALASLRRDAEADDVLDAFVALWTARRIQDGSAVIIPPTPELDRFGMPMRMLA